MILNLADLTAQDVLELLWRCQGRITHLELFNLREWNEGQLRHVTAINTLQRAINEGSTPRLKHVIRRIVHDEPAQSPRQALFQTILGQLPQLREWYALAPLGSRIGTDSTSSSHHTHGMGLVFVETLPPKARAVLQRERNTPAPDLGPCTRTSTALCNTMSHPSRNPGGKRRCGGCRAWAIWAARACGAGGWKKQPPAWAATATW